MEKFEYGEQKLKYEKMRARALTMGLKQYQINSALVPDGFGPAINNDFPELSEEEQKQLASLYDARKLALEEREQVIRVMDPLIEREKKLSFEIDEVNKKICNIQGHRLDEESIQLTKVYGSAYLCVVCGRLVGSSLINDKDVFVKSEDGLKRIRYKK